MSKVMSSMLLFFLCLGGSIGMVVWQSLLKEMPRDTLHIVCTTTILADAVRIIGGNQVSVTVLMGPGIDPHLYRAREGDVHKISQADLVFYHGLHLEGKLTDLFEHMQTHIPTVAVTKTIAHEKLRQSDFIGIYDPHIWHAINLWIEAIAVMRDTLIQYDPKHELSYRSNTDLYMQKLHNLETWICAQIKTIPKKLRILVTTHDAFSYFGAAYGLQVITLQGISTEAEIGTRDVIDLVTFMVNHKVPVMFTESSVPARSIYAVQQAAQAQSWVIQEGEKLYSDALGDATSDAQTYITMMQHNVNAIIKGLIGDPQVQPC